MNVGNSLPNIVGGGPTGGWPRGIDASVPVTGPSPSSGLRPEGLGVIQPVTLDGGKEPKQDRGTDLSGFTTANRRKAHQTQRPRDQGQKDQQQSGKGGRKADLGDGAFYI